MAFEKKVWLGGDTVTAAHLNRIENGIAEALGSGGSGALATPDWNENDPASPSYIKNRPFYEELGEKALIYGPTSIDGAGETGPGVPEGIYYIFPEMYFPGDLTFNDGDHLLLVVDDAEFDIILEGGSDYYVNWAAPSQAQSLYSSGSVLYELYKEDEEWCFNVSLPVTSSDQKIYTISVYKIESDIHKFPARFIDLKLPKNITDGSAGGSVMCIGAAQEDDQYTIGEGAFAEGQNTIASGIASHAEGGNTTASGAAAHAEGQTTTASGVDSHAEGNGTTASGTRSHAEGYQTIAKNASQHVFGEYNIVDPSTHSDSLHGIYVEIVGNGTKNGSTVTRSNARTLDWDGNETLAGKLTVGAAPTADMDVATKKYVDDNAGGGGSSVVVAGEGTGSTVQGLMGNEGEGQNNTATGDYAHVEGGNVITNSKTGEKGYFPNTASGVASHAEGQDTIASGMDSHAEGYGGSYTLNGTTYESGAKGMADHTEGYQTLTESRQPGNHAEGYQTRAIGGAAHAEGGMTTASGSMSHAEGSSTTASGGQSHAEGDNTTASGNRSHAEGCGGTYKVGTTTYESGAKGTADHTEGYMTLTESVDGEGNQGNHAEGYKTRATGGSAHAEGMATTASGAHSHAEGANTTASGSSSHAEGGSTTASGDTSHAEGASTTASGYQSHAEGTSTTASGNNSHVEGYWTTASGEQSHAEGYWTTANHRSQHVFGEYNVADPSTEAASSRGTYVEIVGNGTADNAKSNARTLDWSGNETLAGSLTLGKGTADEVTVTAAQLKALIAMLST